MAYVGRSPRYGFLEGQTATFNGSTTVVTLQRNVSSTDAIDVFIDNVHQEPDVAYTLSSGGNSITFTGTPDNGAVLYIRFHGIAFDTARAYRLVNSDEGSSLTLGNDDTLTLSLDGTTALTATSSGITIPNLTVTGTTTSVNSTNLEIGDNKITLNSDVASDAAPTENAGIVINRGSSADVQFLWNETNDEWYAGNDLATGGIFRVKGGGTTPTLSGSTLAAFTRSAATNNASIAIIGNSGGFSSVHFGDENDEDVGQLNYSHTADTFALNKGLGVTGNIAVSGTVDGVDIAARDGVLTSTTTTAGAALPKSGGTLTGQLNHIFAGGGDYIAKFQNTTSGTPYGVMIKDASSGSTGYPLFLVTNHGGNKTHFRVDSGAGRVGFGAAPSSTSQVTIQGPAGTLGSEISTKALHIIEGGYNNGATFQVSNASSVSRFQVNGDGQVGINATSHYDTTTKLTVGGRINTTDGTVTGSMNYGNGTLVNMGSLSNHPVQLMANNSTIMTLATNGDVNLDNGALKVGGTTVIDSSRNATFATVAVSSDTYLSNASTTGSQITLNSDNTASWLGTRELISFESVGNGADHRTGTLSVKLKKGPSDSALTEFVQINAVSNHTVFKSGKVGIGVDPDATLHVNGPAIIGSDDNIGTSPIAGLHILDNSYSHWSSTLSKQQVALRVETYWNAASGQRAIGTYGGGIGFNHLGGHSATHNENLHSWIGPRVVSTPSHETSALVFATNNITTDEDAGITEKMVIMPNGNVGINHTDPSHELTVAGNSIITRDFGTALNHTYTGTSSYSANGGDVLTLVNSADPASGSQYASIWVQTPQYTGSSGSTRTLRFGGQSVPRAYSADFFVQTRGLNAQLRTRMTVGEEGVMRDYTGNTSANYKWFTPTADNYQVREYDFGNRLYIKKDVSGGNYDNAVFLNRYLPAEFDATFELKGGTPSSTYRHFGIALNANGGATSSAWDMVVLRQNTSNTALNQIRLNGSAHSVQESSIPNFFDGIKRRVRIEKRNSTLRVEISGFQGSNYVWGTHTGVSYTQANGGYFGFIIYEPGATDTWLEVSNLTITEV